LKAVLIYFAFKWKLRDMTFLEMLPIALAICLWHKEFHKKKILFHVNMTVVSILNSMSTKSDRVLKVLRFIVYRSLIWNFHLKAKYINTPSLSFWNSNQIYMTLLLMPCNSFFLNKQWNWLCLITVLAKYSKDYNIIKNFRMRLQPIHTLSMNFLKWSSLKLLYCRSKISKTRMEPSSVKKKNELQCINSKVIYIWFEFQNESDGYPRYN
jgi:hypothetical protein